MEVNRVSQGGRLSFEVVNKNSSGEAVVEETVKIEKVTNPTQKEEKYNEKDINKAVDKLNKFLEDEKYYAQYEVHEKLKDVMIKIVNADTKEVVLEIPPKKILDMVAKMCEMVGVLVDKKA